MHYSDVYTVIKKIKDKTVRDDLKEQLEELEKDANTPNFIAYLKEHQNEGKSIFVLRKEYDMAQVEKVINGIGQIKLQVNKYIDKVNTNNNRVFDSLNAILKDTRKSAKEYKEKYDDLNDQRHFEGLAKKYATHYLPFNQSNDPFKGTDFEGYCWGHTHQYGRLVSEGHLDHLSSASNKQLYDTYNRNCTLVDILFRRVGIYFNVSIEQKMRSAIWNALKDMDAKSTFNFNYAINKEFHSTSLRMVGNGMEYYENNYGVVRFDTREAAVNFIAGHIMEELRCAENGELNLITVYKLPYSNDPSQNLFDDLPIAEVERDSELNTEFQDHPPEVTTAIDALEAYIKELQNGDVKGKIKANELDFLVKELRSSSVAEIKARVDGILDNSQHSLMINRGTGLYLFKSGFKSHSTTESLLQDISNATENNTLTLPPT